MCDTVDAAQARPLADRARQVYRDQGLPLDEQALELAVQRETTPDAVAVAVPFLTERDGYSQALRSFFVPGLFLWVPLMLIGLGFWAGLSAGKTLSRPVPTAMGQSVSFSVSLDGVPTEMCRKALHEYENTHAHVMVDGAIATPDACEHNPHTLSATVGDIPPGEKS